MGAFMNGSSLRHGANASSYIQHGPYLSERVQFDFDTLPAQNLNIFEYILCIVAALSVALYTYSINLRRKLFVQPDTV